MKLNTFVKYNFLVDLYVPRLMIENETTVYALQARDFPVSIVSGRGQTTMFTRVGIEYGSRLLNVRNPRGILLFTVPDEGGPEQYDMHVHSNDPVVDVYGNIVGYRQVLREPQPALTNVKELEPGEETL